MKLSTLYLLALASLINASSIEPTQQTSEPPSQTSPSTTASATYIHKAHTPLVLPPNSTPKLELRDGIAVPNAAPQPIPDAVQMSPITVYQVHGPDGNLIAMPYTQLFVKVPDQWPAPTAGSIGLGTIQGNIGVVKTQSKRALPTAVIEKVNELVRRKAKADVNAAGANRVGLVGMGVGLLVGLGVVGWL